MQQRWLAVCAFLLLAAGLALLLFHPIQSFLSHKSNQEQILKFKQATSLQAASEETAVAYTDLLAAMQQYNRNLYASGQKDLTDAWSYEQPVFDLQTYGLSTDVIGTLRIPRMDLELPVYLGASEENMARGAAVLGQTSMPLGGENTNCVLAGHRGYGGQAFFRDIEWLQTGDPVYLTTYWGELTYRVESTAVIEPDDVQAVMLQPGRDLLTLITCHPYPTNTYRYVVYCTADSPDSTESPSVTETVQATSPPQDTSTRRIALERWLPLAAVPLLLLAGWLLRPLLFSVHRGRRPPTS